MQTGLDSRFYRILTRIGELMITSLLFVLCCLPIFTIGASATALFTVCLKIVQNKTGYIAKDFFHAFKSNFKQASIIWSIVLALGVLFYVDLQISNVIDGTAGIVLRAIFWAFLFIWADFALYVFAVLARFDNTIKATMKNAFWLALGKLPFTISILVIAILPWFITYLKADITWSFIIPFMILIGFGLQGYAESLVFNHIL